MLAIINFSIFNPYPPRDNLFLVNNHKNGTVAQRMPQLPPSTTHPSRRQKTSPTPPRHRHSPYDPPLPYTMSAADPGDVFIHHNVAARFNPAENSDNHDITAAVDFDEDAGQFIAATVNSAPGKVICGHLKTRPDDKHHAKSTN